MQSPCDLRGDACRRRATTGWRLTWAFQEEFARALAARGLPVRGLASGPGSGGAPRDLDKALDPTAFEALERAEIVVHGSREYHESYARSAFWVTNSMLPQHLSPGPGQEYVQTWHGQPLKRLGCDVASGGYALIPLEELHRRYRSEGQRLTRLITPSRFTSEKLTSAFGLSERKAADAIVEVGHPRNDLLRTFGPERAESARARLGVPAGKRAVLYAPTWRDDQHDSRSGYTYRTEVDFGLLRQLLGDGYVVLFRAHYFITNSFDFAAYDGFVIDASGADDVNEVCIASDVLVTDYSSLFFDYANLDRPIVFHMYDRERYETEQRGFYLSPDELPGPVVYDEAGLAEARACGRDATMPSRPSAGVGSGRASPTSTTEARAGGCSSA